MREHSKKFVKDRKLQELAPALSELYQLMHSAGNRAMGRMDIGPQQCHA